MFRFDMQILKCYSHAHQHTHTHTHYKREIYNNLHQEMQEEITEDQCQRRHKKISDEVNLQVQ